MITLSSTATSVVTRSYTLRLAVDSWLGSRLLAADVPVQDATEETDRTSRVPELVHLTVPRVDRGVSWSPVGNSHPLAAYGQKLRVKLGIDIGRGQVEWIQRGWFLIQDSAVDGDVVTVTAVGMLSQIYEARLVSPYQPTGTLVSTLRGLIEPALTVVVDPALTDRAVPSGINYDEDRLGAVMELLDAWPATAYVDPEGVLRVTPVAQSTTPVLTLTNAKGGTVITASGTSSREGAFNAVVARGTAADGGQVQGVAYDFSAASPTRYAGPFSTLPVPYFFSSPLLTTVEQANAAASTILERKKRDAGRQFTVEIVPNPALQVGDVVSVTTDDVTALLCSIEALSLSYVADGGSQRLTVRALA